MRPYTNKMFLLFVFTLWTLHPLSLPAQSISALKFGAVPDDGKDDTRALRRAAEYCRKHPGTTLTIPPGTYRLRDSKAEQLEHEVLQGKMGGDPEKVIFTPYYPYVRGLDFDGSDSVTIEASGATLMCEGWMEPLSITNCRNVTVRGLTIDYKRKPFSQGTVQEVNENSFVVQFDDRRIITNEIPITRITLWDDAISGFYAEPLYFPKRRLLGGNRVEFEGHIPQRLQGTYMAALHSFHFRPAIFIGNSVSTKLDGVSIHSQPGMGIVGFDSTDITICRLSVSPAPGFLFSTNTDATHFASCRGKISFDQCTFRGQGDDATNVHGYYHNIASVTDGTATLQLQSPTFTHAQMADVPCIGDSMELVRIATLVPEKTLVVTAVEHKEKEKDVRIRLDGELPENYSEYYLLNASKLPHLSFCRSTVWGQLARGVLVKTRGMEIKGNTFRGCTGTAIHVGAESGWKEGSHAKDVTIADNVIVNCGLGAGTQFGASGIAVVIDAPETDNTFLHENIRIYGNTIIGNGSNGCGIAIRNARHVELAGNHIEGCDKAVIIHSTDDLSIK